LAHPEDACEPVGPPGSLTTVTTSNEIREVLVATESGCKLDDKILHAQRAGYKDIIIVFDSWDEINRRLEIISEINVNLIYFGSDGNITETS